MKFIVKLLISVIAIIILAQLLPGVSLSPPYTTAILVAVVLAVLNALVKPILIVLTLPATIVTMGLFLLVINALIVLLADKIVDGFTVNGFWTALLFSILLSILQSIMQSLVKEDKKS